MNIVKRSAERKSKFVLINHLTIKIFGAIAKIKLLDFFTKCKL